MQVIGSVKKGYQDVCVRVGGVASAGSIVLDANSLEMT